MMHRSFYKGFAGGEHNDDVNVQGRLVSKNVNVDALGRLRPMKFLLAENELQCGIFNIRITGTSEIGKYRRADSQYGQKHREVELTD
jgi:hypothetical protein